MLDDESLIAALQVANIPTLLAVLVQLTGDMRWTREPYRPRRPRGLGDEDDGGLPPELQETIRAAAAKAIGSWQNGGPVAVPDPSDREVIDILSATLGENVGPEYGPMMRWDLRDTLTASCLPAAGRRAAPRPGSQAVRPQVLIVGAGPCGIAAGVKLAEAGIPYVIIEKESDVGGAWHQNGYPGASVDTPSHLYSFTFAPWSWSRYFAPRAEVGKYLRHIADRFDVRPHIRFRTEVTSATWHDEDQEWKVAVRGPDGNEEVLTAAVFMPAVGALSRPKIPRIEGLDTFAGPVFHSARWPEGLNVTGKRVAVIGTGATSMQLVPAISGVAESVVIVQRSPQWAAPFERFQVSVPEPLRALMEQVPHYAAWFRLRQAWIFNDKNHSSLLKDPEWPHPERSLNALNEAHRVYLTSYIERELGERTDLLPKVLPDYPPFGKRMLLDNRWFRTICRPDVILETDPLRRVGSDRLIMENGTEHRVDIVVLATGFDAVRFLAPMHIVGRSGVSLAKTWDDDNAQAFLGIAVPDFPNMFLLNGPNTQTAHGGSLMYIAECQVRYIVDVLKKMEGASLAVAEIRQDVFQDYNRRVEQAHELMVWTHPGVNSYYRNSRGRVVVNSPFRIVDIWKSTIHAEMADFSTSPKGEARPCRGSDQSPHPPGKLARTPDQ